MHKSLAEAFFLRKTGVTVRHLCEIGEHTAIPATETVDAVTGLEIADVVALAGRANERTSTATETSFGKLSPLGRIEVLFGLAAAECVFFEVCERKLAEDLDRKSVV